MNRTRIILTQTSSHNQPKNHDLTFTLTTKPLVILKRHVPSWAMMGPCYLFFGYYNVHPQKKRVVLSQDPHVLWASGCWHYERTSSNKNMGGVRCDGWCDCDGKTTKIGQIQRPSRRIMSAVPGHRRKISLNDSWRNGDGSGIDQVDTSRHSAQDANILGDPSDHQIHQTIQASASIITKYGLYATICTTGAKTFQTRKRESGSQNAGGCGDNTSSIARI